MLASCLGIIRRLGIKLTFFNTLTTFYTRFGDIFAVACLVATIFFTCIQLINRIKTRGN